MFNIFFYVWLIGKTRTGQYAADTRSIAHPFLFAIELLTFITGKYEILVFQYFDNLYKLEK